MAPTLLTQDAADHSRPDRFLLSELHLNSLVNQDSRKRLRRALQTLPKELDRTYDDTMFRIENQDFQKIERARQVLSWISFAERPLTLRELQCALALEAEDTEFDEEAVPNENALLSVCCGLVVVEHKSHIVRFVHFTTETYIQQIRRTRFPSAQKLLFEACLTYLFLKVFASGPCHARDLLDRTKANSLLIYAALHWGDHARKAAAQGLSTDELILRFLRVRGDIGGSLQAAVSMDPSERWYNFEGSYTHISGLHIVAGFGLEELAGTLINQGADVNARDSHGCTPLHKAVAKGARPHGTAFA